MGIKTNKKKESSNHWYSQVNNLSEVTSYEYFWQFLYIGNCQIYSCTHRTIHLKIDNEINIKRKTTPKHFPDLTTKLLAPRIGRGAVTLYTYLFNRPLVRD